MQSFKDYEVVISDDSPGDEVKKVVNDYSEKLPIRYFHNATPAGTPANWNMAIDRANGRWIKLMHDDDAFAGANSLSCFVKEIQNNPHCNFLYCGYNNITDSLPASQNFPSSFRRNAVLKNPGVLLAGNIIGPPSVTLHKKDSLRYDTSLKWLVDIDFYISMLQSSQTVFIKKRLVHIGINPQQVTKYSSGIIEVEIPEFFIVYLKLKKGLRKNIFVYDAAWRLMRNMKVKDIELIRSAGYNGLVPEEIKRIINIQKHFNNRLLKFGPFSKCLMFFSYVTG